MTQPYILGIDIGTGSTKAVALGSDNEVIGTSQHYYPVTSPQPGYSEQDPKLILSAFYSCLTDVIKKLGYPPQAVSFSSAMHSVIPVDQSGDALASMMTWADSRSEQIAEKLRGTEQGKRIYRTCGTPISAMTPLCKLIWLRENNPQLFSSAYKFISIKEYIWYNLFGEFQVDYSLASAMGMFDIQQLAWSAEALDLAGITIEKLSTPFNTTYQRSDLKATVAASVSLPENIPFIIGSSDGCCANLGSFVTEAGTASLTIGTSGAIRITSSKPVIDEQAMIFNYLLNQNTFVCGGAVNNGGIVFDWLLKSFLDKKLPGHSEYDYAFERIQTVPAGSDGLLFLPYLYGERAPLWDTQTCGVFFNIKPQHTRDHFLRAGLEGICFALNNVLQTVEAASSPIDCLHISGGFITSALWTQMLADITGKKLAIVQQGDASAVGAVFLARQSLRIDQEKKVPVKLDQNILPDVTAHEKYQRNFIWFKKLYVDLKDTMHQLQQQEKG